jgi:hypothetical protein
MFKVDLHAHTLGSDGRSPAADIVRAAVSTGLDGVCLTDHHANTVEDNTEVYRVAAALEEAGIRAFIGVEYSTSLNHLLIFGVDVPWGAWGMYPDTQAVIDEVNAMGGACVLPHPYKVYKRSAGERLKELTGLAAVEGYNGQVEVDHRETNRLARQAAISMGLPITAGSDAHHASMLGVVWTEFKRPITDDLDLCAALREGNFSVGTDKDRLWQKRRAQAARPAPRPRRKVLADKYYTSEYFANFDEEAFL